MLILFVILFPMLASLWISYLRKRSQGYRDRYIRIVPVIELVAVLGLLLMPQAELALDNVCGMGLYFKAASLPVLLAVIAASMWAFSAQNCPHYFAHAQGSNRFYRFWLMTLGAMMGVFLASDFFTLFVFFEMMSFTSFVWVAQNETASALRAGGTYLAVAVIGGMSLLVGIVLLYNLFGTVNFDQLSVLVETMSRDKRPMLYVAGGCCLVGFGAKAGLFPLHIWLPKAHPVAPAPASALLSGILTKSGVFGMILVSRLFFAVDGAWSAVLLTLGTITMVLGAVLAVSSIDLKRTLACSSMSQIGFITIGIAMQGFLVGENALASWGTVLHMLNHATTKLVLFLAAGVIYVGAHSLNLNEIRGWGRNKWVLKGTFFVGAASIVGVPGFSGYISKTLLHESIVEYIHILEGRGMNTDVFIAVEWLFLFSGGLTAAYMTKLFCGIFMSPKAAGQKHPVRDGMTQGTKIALSTGAFLLVFMGVTPYMTMNPLAEWASAFFNADHIHHMPAYFAWINVKGACTSLMIGAIVYVVVVRRVLMEQQGHERVYVDLWPEKRDIENAVYRPAIAKLTFVGALLARLVATAGDTFVNWCETILFVNAPGIFQPRKTDNFGAYGRKPMRFLVEETFAFDLLVAGFGLIGLLLYILL